MLAVSGDVGGQIFVDVYELDETENKVSVDISEAILVRLDASMQDGSTEQWIASVSSNQIVYTIQPGQLVDAGTITLRPYIKWAPDQAFHGTPIFLNVIA